MRAAASDGDTMLRQFLGKLRAAWGQAGRTRPSRVSNDSPAPHSSTDWLERGRALRRTGALDDALTCFQRAVDLRHDDVDALLEQAETCRELGRQDEARDAFELALALQPGSVRALAGLGALAGSATPLEALQYYRRALELAPHDPALHFKCGLAHNRSGDTQAAQAAYERAIGLDSAYVAAIVNLGLLHLSQLGDVGRARQLFERAVELQPDLVAAQANLGLALQEEGRFEEAIAHYERLIAAYPEVVEYRWNRGLAYLSIGDFRRGWDDYELRTARAARQSSGSHPLPAWDGAPLAGGQLLVYGEQGLGDEVMFASCVPDVLRRTPDVVLACDPRLAGCFERSFPAAHVHGVARHAQRDWLGTYPRLGAQIAIGSLPRLFRRSWADFPAAGGYLRADPARAAHWKTTVDQLGAGLKIGICWRGGTRKTRSELRSLNLEQCLPLWSVAGCNFISLHAAEHPEDRARLERHGARLQAWPEATGDIGELTALVSVLDLIIAVPSTAAHIAGAQNRPLWLLLSASPEWRYLSQGDRIPWYPSARLFRQRASGNWRDVIEQVRQHLAVCAAPGSVRRHGA